MTRLTLAVAVLICNGCAHTQAGEMSAPEHRNEARLHTAKADDLRANVDPAERRAMPEWNARVYSPTQAQLEAADRELRAAAEHLQAARTLEVFEDARCAEISKAERAACPLLASQVLRVSETEAGLLLELKPSADAVDTQRRLDCHLAYAHAKGFDRPSCPLFVKGMRIGLLLGNGARWIAMTADDPKIAEQIREQARRIFRTEAGVSKRY